MIGFFILVIKKQILPTLSVYIPFFLPAVKFFWMLFSHDMKAMTDGSILEYIKKYAMCYMNSLALILFYTVFHSEKRETGMKCVDTSQRLIKGSYSLDQTSKLKINKWWLIVRLFLFSYMRCMFKYEEVMENWWRRGKGRAGGGGGGGGGIIRWQRVNFTHLFPETS